MLTLNILTLAAFLVLSTLFFWTAMRSRRWQGIVANEAAGATQGVFVGTLSHAHDDGLPSIVVAPDEITRDMRRAGFYHPDAPAEFNFARSFLAIIGMLLTGIFLVVVGMEHPRWFWAIVGWGLVLSAAAYALPWLYVRLKGRDRVARVQRSLPDATDMLSMGLTGGLTVLDSLGHVSRELHGSHPELATEFEIVRRHAELSGLGSAFQQFAGRVDCPEVQSLSAIVNQSERLGSNINTAIREYADGVRTKLRQSADERASKAGIQLLFPLVLCLAPAAMIILWGPAALELRNFFRGFAAVENQQVTRSGQ